MNFLSLSQCESANPRHGKVIQFDSILISRKKHAHPCIFCGATVLIKTFKGKAVCSACLESIPNLFVQKKVQLL